MRRLILIHHGRLRVARRAEDGLYSVKKLSNQREAKRFLKDYMYRPAAMFRLRALLADLGLRHPPGKRLDIKTLPALDLIDQLAKYIVSERIVVAEQVDRTNAPSVFDDKKEPPPAAAAPASEQKKKKLTWIEIKVVEDASDQPITPVRLAIKTPDGNEAFYTTNSDGLIRIDDIDEGTCDVRCEAKGAEMPTTMNFVTLGDKPSGKTKAGSMPAKTSTLRVLEVEDRKVKTGDTLDSLAAEAKIARNDLTTFNFQTNDPTQVNAQVGAVVGSTKTDGSGTYQLDSADKPGILRLPKKFEQTGLATGKCHVIRTVAVPDVKRVWVIELEDAHFHFDSSVLLPDYYTEDANPDMTKHVTVFDVLAKALNEAKEHPERKMLITGHTDTKGSAEYNLPLSQERADAALAALMGDRDKWVSICKGRHKVEDHQLILKWMSQNRGMDCDPGDIDNKPGPKTTAAIKAFQDQFNDDFGQNIGVDGVVGNETWGAFFDIYMLEMQRAVKAKDAAELETLRGNVKFVDDSKKAVGCGENFPIEKRGVDEFRSRINRRVELLYFLPAQLPKLDCHSGAKCNAAVCQVNDPKKFIPTVIPVVPPPPGPTPTISFVKIQTSDASGTYAEDDDFSPRLGEKIKFHVKVEKLPAGFSGKVRLSAGRLTNRPAGAKPAEKNEAFTRCGRVELAVAAGADPLPVELDWDGKTTAAVAQEFSDRTTTNNNSGAAVNIPLNSMAKGDVLIHGLYVVDQVMLLDSYGRVVGKDRPSDIDFSVPQLCNLQFNANWPLDLAAYGLGVFQTELEEALRRFGGRDYLIRDATPTNRINARFISDAGIPNNQCIRISVGGNRADGTAGLTPRFSAPRMENIYAFSDGHAGDVEIFPGTFIQFNHAHSAVGPTDQAEFQATFGPLGLSAAATGAAIGTAAARSVDASGAVTGAADATDKGNITLTFDDDGLATVVSKDTSVVPAARAADLQRALRRLLLLVGNTTNHEAGHAFGIAGPVDPRNQITINGTTVTAPLLGDDGAHNKVTNNTNIVDSGHTRSFVRRVEATGIKQHFSDINTTYLRDCIPYDRKDN